MLGPDLWLDKCTAIGVRRKNDNMQIGELFIEDPATDEEIKLFKRYNALDKI